MAGAVAGRGGMQEQGVHDAAAAGGDEAVDRIGNPGGGGQPSRSL